MKTDYLNLFESCVLTEDASKIRELEYVCKIAVTHQILYEAVSRHAFVPWALIAAIHFRESSQNFKAHLHNGDPLSARTVHVPAGRPKLGEPPFTWVDSAIDALSKVWRPKQWDVPGCLEFLERYNGLGYQKRGINSPYLWNYTDKYVSGLFVADGKFDSSKVERRPGAVAILKTLEAEGFDFTDVNGSDLH